MSSSLKQVYDALLDLAADRSRKIKESKIKKYLDLEYFKEVIIYTYDYNKTYNVTNINFVNNLNYDLSVNGIFKYLDYLSSKRGASNQEKQNLSILSSIDHETVDVVNRIINKDLKVGIGPKTFKNFIPQLPFFEIMTCKKDVSKFLKWNGKNPYYWSVKKDGTRVLNIVYEDHVQAHLSRSGLEYPNFNVFDEDLICLAKHIKNNYYNINYPILIDGEAISDNKSFNHLMSQVRRLNNPQLDSFRFKIFDIAHENIIFKHRYQILEESFNENTFNRLDLLEHYLCEFNEDQVYEKMREVIRVGIPNIDEGIVIKMAHSVYEFKEHSKYWCKVKPTDTLDLPVTGFEFGKAGTKYENVIGALIVDYKGTKVKVGSGLSDSQREEFLENLPSLIEVEFKEITPDGSLREPIMLRVRNDKTISDSE